MKKVNMRLVGEDGNAFAILGRFKKAAKDAGWTSEEIKKVMDDAMFGDYDHLLSVISKNISDESEENNDEDEDFDEDDYDDEDDEGEYYPDDKVVS